MKELEEAPKGAHAAGRPCHPWRGSNRLPSSNPRPALGATCPALPAYSRRPAKQVCEGKRATSAPVLVCTLIQHSRSLGNDQSTVRSPLAVVFAHATAREDSISQRAVQVAKLLRATYRSFGTQARSTEGCLLALLRVSGAMTMRCLSEVDRCQFRSPKLARLRGKLT